MVNLIYYQNVNVFLKQLFVILLYYYSITLFEVGITAKRKAKLYLINRFDDLESCI